MKFALLLASLLSLSWMVPHPQHISIMQLDHNEENKSLEVTLKSFVDDVEMAIADQQREKVFLNQIGADDPRFAWVESYIRTQLTFKLNEKDIDYDWVGWELDKDEVFMYFEIMPVRNIKKLEVRNTMLMKQFADQTNIVHLKYQGQNKSLFLQQDTPARSFKLED